MKLFAALVVLAVPAPVSPAPPPSQLTPKQIYKLAAASSVRVRVDGPDPGSGSGTVIASDHLGVDVLTCRHVVGKERFALVDFDEEGKQTVTRAGFVVKADEKADLALIHVGAISLPSRPIATVEPELFDDVYVVSSPQSIMRQASRDVLNTKDMASGKVWTLTGESIPGMSGAGALNERGELVCVIQATWHDDGTMYTQIALAIPLKTIRAFVSGVTP